MTDRLKQISLRKFRETVADLHEVVEVSKRDANGNINILGFWTPYMTYPADAVTLPTPEEFAAEHAAEIAALPDLPGELVLPVDDESFPMGEDSEFDRHPRTAVIKTPEDAAVAVAVNPVRAVPKPSQRKKRV